MEETIISWNVANWITICIMVLLGWVAWKTANRFVAKKKGG